MSDTILDGDNTTKFKQSYYYHNYIEKEFSNNKYYDLIFSMTNETNECYYWLEGRYTHLYGMSCNFGMNRVYITRGSDKIIDGTSLCGSRGGLNSRWCALRPIVSIDLRLSNCNISKEEINGDIKFKLNW